MKTITYLMTIALGFMMCYLSIQGYFKTSVASEITTFSLGFTLLILTGYAVITNIFKPLNK